MVAMPQRAEHRAPNIHIRVLAMKRLLTLLAVAMCSAAAQATLVQTTDPTIVTAFQAGTTVNTFEAVPTRVPVDITAYAAGVPVSADAMVFNQIAGVQFSVGGMVGVNMPALYRLGNDLADDAASPRVVLGPVDFDFNTNFAGGSFIEIFFPTKVSKVGFWLNGSLDDVTLIAADTNFAFSGLTETTLETHSGQAGFFVGIERASADIGGFKIITKGSKGFTIDDFSFGGAPTTTVPEPASGVLVLAALALVGVTRRASAR
jgi:hypothetical protein